MRSQQRRAAIQKNCYAGGCALGVRGEPVVLSKPAYASQGQGIKTKLTQIMVESSSALGAGRRLDPVGEAAPKRGGVVQGVPVVLAAPMHDKRR